METEVKAIDCRRHQDVAAKKKEASAKKSIKGNQKMQIAPPRTDFKHFFG